MMKKFLLASLLLTGQAWGWGPTGHRTVGEIAENFVDIDVRLKIHHILQGQNLARVSTWPDEIKSDPETYKYTFNWHYTDWPDEMHDHSEETSSGKLMTSINEQLQILKNPEATQDKKAFALKFLVHLVGDLHMPLHVGNGLDLGGNNCKVLFHKKPTNLHALWDEGMIDFTKLSYTELAKFIRQGAKVEDIREWKKGTPIDWARESKELRSQIYPTDVVVSQEPLSQKQYCRRDIVLTESDMPKLGYEYSYKFVPVVERRLFQAGVRLAVLLNQALAIPKR